MSSASGATVSVHGLSKKFCRHLRTSLWYGLCDIAAEARIWRPASRETLREKEFWSLRDLSFELHPGESLAIIGRNGAGKSTLLKLLHGLIKPDAGVIRLRGRVGALIELGAGLDPVLTGYENILLRAALLGVSRAQVQTLLPAIVEFTGLGDAIGTPVRYFSSGMVSRLAYSVAAHLQPDVLLVDEVLAVGDFNFQRKCMQHMTSYLAGGGSLILVSHQAHQIQAVCQRGLVLEEGRPVFAGTATEALDYYFTQHTEETPADGTTRPAAAALSELRPVAIDGVTLTGPRPVVHTGDDVTVTLTCRSWGKIENVSWSVFLYTRDGHVCITAIHRPEPMVLSPGQQTVSCRLRRLPLTAGEYQVRACVFDLGTLQPLDMFGWEDSPGKLRVESTASLESNVQQMIQQLVVSEAEWSE